MPRVFAARGSGARWRIGPRRFGCLQQSRYPDDRPSKRKGGGNTDLAFGYGRQSGETAFAPAVAPDDPLNPQIVAPCEDTPAPSKGCLGHKYPLMQAATETRIGRTTGTTHETFLPFARPSEIAGYRMASHTNRLPHSCLVGGS